jgi:hypothetical protein
MGGGPINEYPRLSDEFVNSCLDTMEMLGEAHAVAKSRLRALEKKEKFVLAEIISRMMIDGAKPTAAKDLAPNDKEYREWLKKYETAVADETRADEDLQRTKLRFEAWRTVSANYRRN